MDNYYLTRYLIASQLEAGAPVGTIISYSGGPAHIPKYFLVCRGQKVGKMQYPELYAVIGDAYQQQIPNLERHWWEFWEPKTIPEPLFYDFRLPSFEYNIRKLND